VHGRLATLKVQEIRPIVSKTLKGFAHPATKPRAVWSGMRGR